MRFAGDYEGMIERARERLSLDRRAFVDPEIKTWCALRWRNLFVHEAVEDDVALAAATTENDRRPAAQRIAERYLRGDAITEWNLRMPPAEKESMRNVTLLFCPGS